MSSEVGEEARNLGFIHGYRVVAVKVPAVDDVTFIIQSVSVYPPGNSTLAFAAERDRLIHKLNFTAVSDPNIGDQSMTVRKFNPDTHRYDFIILFSRSNVLEHLFGYGNLTEYEDLYRVAVGAERKIPP